MAIWQSEINKLLPGTILTIYSSNGEEQIEECDKLRVVKIMSQSQNWNCSEEEVIERIKKSSEDNTFSIGSEKFWYEHVTK